MLYLLAKSTAELRAEDPSAPAACSVAAGEEHAALKCALVPPGLRSGGTLFFNSLCQLSHRYMNSGLLSTLRNFG